MRRYILGLGPLFPSPPHSLFLGPEGIFCCVVCGILAGGLSALLTKGVYATEDLFAKVPLHWMWWPVLGGLAIGLGGLIFPQALGVGYEVIGALLQGPCPEALLAGILLVKSSIWLLALGSGTSGGVLAPLLMMGGALGGLEALVFPNEGVGFWPLISMGAILGGTMRSPLTGAIFAMELTHDGNSLLPLLVASVTAYGFTVLTMKRSILTEKLARRGFHLTREYEVDPMEILSVREVMRTQFTVLKETLPPDQLLAHLQARGVQRLYPIISEQGVLRGLLSAREIENLIAEPRPGSLMEHATREAVVAYPDERLRTVVNKMAARGVTRLPVVRPDSGLLVGLVSLTDLLRARQRLLEAETRREIYFTLGRAHRRAPL
jgi:CBS domain-containing protein